MTTQHAMLRGALALGLFSLVTAGSVALTRAVTAERIAAHELAYQHRQLQEVLPRIACRSACSNGIGERFFRYPTRRRWATVRLTRVGGCSKAAKPPPFCRLLPAKGITVKFACW